MKTYKFVNDEKIKEGDTCYNIAHQVIFKHSDVHQGHYVYVNGEATGIVVNLFAYRTIDEYKIKVDKQIKDYETNKTKRQVYTCK